MPRHNNNAGGRRFDTRLTFAEISRIIGLSPKQRIIMRRFIISKRRNEVNKQSK